MNYFLNILDIKACKNEIENHFDDEVIILISHYSINVQAKYEGEEGGEQCGYDFDDLESRLGVSLFVNDYDDLCCYGEQCYDFTLEELESQGYFGPDASLETSIFEYGLCAKEEINKDGDMRLNIFYKISEGVFDRSTMTIEEAWDLTKEEWFDLKGVENSIGQSLTIENARELLWFIQDALSYHGYENIFGSTYHNGIKIKNTNA